MGWWCFGGSWSSPMMVRRRSRKPELGKASPPGAPDLVVRHSPTSRAAPKSIGLQSSVDVLGRLRLPNCNHFSRTAQNDLAARADGRTAEHRFLPVSGYPTSLTVQKRCRAGRPAASLNREAKTPRPPRRHEKCRNRCVLWFGRRCSQIGPRLVERGLSL